MARDHKRQATDNNWTTAGQTMARDHKRDEAITQNSTNNYHSRSPRSRFFSAPVIFKISARLSSGPPPRAAHPHHLQRCLSACAIRWQSLAKLAGRAWIAWQSLGMRIGEQGISYRISCLV